MSDAEAALREWLSSIGLGRYADLLVEQEFDSLGALALATEGDLASVGISKVGARRKLLTAIAVLSEAVEGAPVQPSPSRTVSAPAPTPAYPPPGPLGPPPPLVPAGAPATPSAATSLPHVAPAGAPLSHGPPVDSVDHPLTPPYSEPPPPSSVPQQPLGHPPPPPPLPSPDEQPPSTLASPPALPDVSAMGPPPLSQASPSIVEREAARLTARGQARVVDRCLLSIDKVQRVDPDIYSPVSAAHVRACVARDVMNEKEKLCEMAELHNSGLREIIDETAEALQDKRTANESGEGDIVIDYREWTDPVFGAVLEREQQILRNVWEGPSRTRDYHHYRRFRERREASANPATFADRPDLQAMLAEQRGELGRLTQSESQYREMLEGYLEMKDALQEGVLAQTMEMTAESFQHQETSILKNLASLAGMDVSGKFRGERVDGDDAQGEEEGFSWTTPGDS